LYLRVGSKALCVSSFGNYIVARCGCLVQFNEMLWYLVPGGGEGPSGVLICSENYLTYKNFGDQPDIRCPIPRRRVRELAAGFSIIMIIMNGRRKSWLLQFHNSELYFRTRPPNLCSRRRCERDFLLIPTHFYHATMLQLRAFARHSAS